MYPSRSVPCCFSEGRETYCGLPPLRDAESCHAAPTCWTLMASDQIVGIVRVPVPMPIHMSQLLD